MPKAQTRSSKVTKPRSSRPKRKSGPPVRYGREEFMSNPIDEPEASDDSNSHLENGGWLVGLDLFNDETCPSGHISRPTQVNVSQSCFNSLNILLKLNYIVQVWGLVEVNCVISDRRISHFSQEFHNASLGNCLEEGIQWVSCVVFITTFL